MARSTSSIKLLIFVSLLIDLLAFTLPLPLFPRIIAAFVEKEAFTKTPTLLSRSLAALRAFRQRLIPTTLSAFDEGIGRSHDVVLLGGAMGSLFSLAQFLSSPFIGKLADRHGRRPVLLVSMLGNIASGVIWLFSTTFATYLFSRAVGGFSECNVQLAIAALADITPPDQRSRSLALVGIAFSLAFITGPIIGARLATSRLPRLPLLDAARLNVYAFPAALSVALLVVETVLLFAFLPETQSAPRNEVRTDQVARSRDVAASRLRQLEQLHLNFLFVFSGVEFSLTFLTFDLFGFTNREQGYLLASMGALAAFLQGTIVRRGRLSPRQLALLGLASCCLALGGLAVLPIVRDPLLLRLAAAGLAITSATVVTSLTAIASTEAGASEQGTVLGRFRSTGQLGRALGPLCAVSLYWSIGPTRTYALGCLGMLAIIVMSASEDGILNEPARIKAD